MRNKDSETHRHIVATTEKMLEDRAGREIHIADIADNASVGIQTIYYYFDSRVRLIAEAQMSTYFRLREPLLDLLAVAETALVHYDESDFWTAIGDSLMVSWSYGKGDDRWKFVQILVDIWADPRTQGEFAGILDIQFDRWIVAIRKAKSLGWIDDDTNADALVATFWVISIGQAIYSNTSKIDCTSQNIRDFYLNTAKSKQSIEPCLNEQDGSSRIAISKK